MDKEELEKWVMEEWLKHYDPCFLEEEYACWMGYGSNKETRDPQMLVYWFVFLRT